MRIKSLIIDKLFQRNRSDLYLICGGVIGLAILLKLYYRQAETEDLLWLLQPTAWLVESFTGFPLTYQEGLGFVNQNQQFVITKSCAGLNFLVITMLMGSLMFVHYFKGYYNQLIFSILLIFSSYLWTIGVNSFRIINLVLFQDYLNHHTGFANSINHLIQGVFVDFSFLIVYFALLQFIIPKYFNQNEKTA